MTAYPLLTPYLCALAQNMIEFGARADGPVFNFPLIAQRLFEVGVSRIDEPYMYTDAPQKLMALGELAHVDISAQITTITGLLKRKKPREREQAIDLLLLWLHDGRLTPQRLADELTRVISATEQGFTYLEQSLASLSVAEPAAGAVVQEAIEQVLGSDSDKMQLTAKNQSLLLTRLTEILEDNQRTVFNEAARAKLQALAGSKKKTVAVQKAREVLAYQGPAQALPLIILSIAHLAEALEI